MLVLRPLPCLKRYSSCHTLSRCVFLWSCTFKYTPYRKASRFASGKRLTLQTSLKPALRKLGRYSSPDTLSPLRAPWSRTILYAPVVACAGSLPDGRLSPKTSVYSTLRKLGRYSSPDTLSPLRFCSLSLPPLMVRGGVTK